MENHFLDKDRCKQIVDKGVNVGTNLFWWKYEGNEWVLDRDSGEYPALTLGDLVNLLPKYIYGEKIEGVSIHLRNNIYYVKYGKECMGIDENMIIAIFNAVMNCIKIN